MLDAGPRKEYITNFHEWRSEPPVNQDMMARKIIEMIKGGYLQENIANSLKINRHIIVRIGEINGLARRGKHKGHRTPVVPFPILYDIDLLPPAYVLRHPEQTYPKDAEKRSEEDFANDPEEGETEGFDPTQVYTKPERRPQSYKSGDMDAVRELTPKGSLQVDGSLRLEGIPMLISYYMNLLGKALNLDIQHVEIHHATGLMNQDINKE